MEKAMKESFLRALHQAVSSLYQRQIVEFLRPWIFYGPKLWAISPIPSQLSILSGRNHLDISALHTRYGPVVRIGPTELVFFSAQVFRDIYGFRPGGRSCLKSRRQYVLPPNGADNLVSAVGNSTHSKQRRLLAQAFSERALREQEGLIRAYVDTLVAKLREAARQGGPERKAAVDIKNWLNYTTFDITGDLMFGEPFVCLKESKLHP
ncbi:hypothetical protein W97_09358 [Coniosporium apollinis CBS 100218]|uniref:Cytochrome P450 n=1 Tax=Coniosporium apollinis (strain CBS 100218) TaxID=1168221 RepID=R7Z7I0_CONA1|nr:uncharacterized protein W97_09358 [Coniosporium apollinis CBS 100218]EON70092.1 hypothetical protein W97_09358 [Coniosporium apollinis CBS 100218]